MRTETLAVVFTDIKGYTAATSKQSHQENAALLKKVERLVAPVVRSFSGRVIKSIGDAYMIVFRSPTEAVRCARAIQDRLHQYNTNSRADQGIHIRIAINAGEVRVHRGDVFGDPVNIAARIESVTPADAIYFSQAVYLTMNRSEIETECVGEYELKGIPEPVVVYRAVQFANKKSDGKATTGSAPSASGLPYGGAELDHWRKMRWVQRAYVAMWMLAVVGLTAAAYARYRPGADFGSVLVGMKTAVEDGRPMDALSMTAQIPESALVEKVAARRWRREAVRLLLAGGDLKTARAETAALLTEDGRDAEALMLSGLVHVAGGGGPLKAVRAFANALRLDPELAKDTLLIEAVVGAYADASARKNADELVAKQIKEGAITALKSALSSGSTDRAFNRTVASRLAALGAGGEVDWVELAIDDLKATNCKTRKAAIKTLQSKRDERAVGPLMKLADSKGCGAFNAKLASQAILKR